jgi:hypothetical protein
MARKSLGSLVGKDADLEAAAGEKPAVITPAAPPAQTEQKTSTTEAPPAPTTTLPAANAEEASAAPRRTRGARRTATTDTDSDRETASKGVPVHLTEELNERLQAYMAATRWSHHNVLLDAIESTYSRLPQLIAEATAAASREAERTVLFSRPSPTAPKASGEARVKHTVKMSDTNRNILDRITAEVEAPSRNFLITVAYEAYLPTIEKS